MIARNADWIDWQIAIWEGRVKFYPNNRIDRIMSEPEAMVIYDRLAHTRPHRETPQ